MDLWLPSGIVRRKLEALSLSRYALEEQSSFAKDRLCDLSLCGDACRHQCGEACQKCFGLSYHFVLFFVG